MPVIIADREKFRQIVLNLLNNAVKFTPDGGEIHLSAELVQGSEFRIQDSDGIYAQYPKSDTNVDFLQISVKDTGIGIKPEDQQKLFSCFFSFLLRFLMIRSADNWIGVRGFFISWATR